MFQAIQIETQSKLQSVTHLQAQRASGCASGELAFDGTKEAFDRSAAPVEAFRKRQPHLGANSARSPHFLRTLGGDHTLRPELLPDRGVIPLSPSRYRGRLVYR
jgi:hypothetical protein